MTKHWTKQLPWNACTDAVVWAETQPSFAEAWANCERGDWMLWLAGKWSGGPRSKSRKTLVLAACECARLSLKDVPEGENRPRQAIETAEAWTRGEATLVEVHAAANAANASYAAYASYASNAAYAAYASYAGVAGAGGAAAAFEECADIVRKHYPQPPRKR